MKKKMKAVIYTEFGPPEVLQVKEIERPIPKDDSVLIRIHATTVEKEDPDMRKSPGFNGIRKPKKQILGMFLAGEIKIIGNNVTKYQVGDRVYGSVGMGLGTTAEYISIPQDSAIVKIPDNVSYGDAVAILNGALTALPFLRGIGKIQKGQNVLINGASGSVGSAAIQIAKDFETNVTGVCSTKNLELVKSIGADNVIDYTKDDFTKRDNKYDIVFDTVGKSSFSQCKSILKSDGIFLATVPNLAIMGQFILTSLFGKKKVKFIASSLRSTKKKIIDLLFINKMFEENRIHAVIDKSYTLEQIADAHIHVATGHKRGSVVISIE